MTAITLTTVGYKEVRELDDLGRAVDRAAFLRRSRHHLRNDRVRRRDVRGRGAQREAAAATNGRAVAGAERSHHRVRLRARRGDRGARAARAGVPFVVIDIVPASVEAASRGPPRRGGRRHPRRRPGRGRRRARARADHRRRFGRDERVRHALRAVAQSKHCSSSRGPTRRARRSKLRQAGAHRVVSPYTRAGRQIAELATRPRVADFIDFALSHGQLAFSIEEVEVAGRRRSSVERSVAARATGIHAGDRHAVERDFEPNPPTDRVLAAGEQLIVSGTAEVLRELRAKA